ncbi:MAG: nuclear transport factor 2 family protein [Solirubrobacteraceae bacterium]
MSTHPTLDALKSATQNGGAAGLADYITDDVEFTETDQRTPPAAPAVHRGRDALLALGEDLERRGVQFQIDDGFIAGDRGAMRVICTYPDGKQVVEHALLTLREGKIARWSGVQAWDQ